MGLSLFATREAVATRGVAFANVLWAVQMGQQVALGLFFLFSRHIQIRRLFGAPAAMEAGLEAEEAEYQAESDALAGGASAGARRLPRG